jgi:RNA polymerase sigma-70 factor (ECF subfamily)
MQLPQKPHATSRADREEQFDEVLSQRLPAFRRIACQKLNNPADAEDAVQDALLAAYTHLDQFNGEARMSTWVTTIVINCARMRLRGASRHLYRSLDQPMGDEEEYSFAEQIADSSPSPEEEWSTSELHERVLRLLNGLSLSLRRALQLRDLYGLTTSETAAVLGVTESAVKTRVTRGRAKLRELMTQTRCVHTSVHAIRGASHATNTSGSMAA